MKVLLVNGNTTQAVTDRVVAEATRCASPETAITGITARFGVSIVSTEAQEEIAGHAVLDALAANFAGHDAAILAISFDTALLGARQIVPIPVVGMTEASLLTACMLGRRFRPDQLRAKQPLDVSGSRRACRIVAADGRIRDDRAD
jgi:allantoin racemase